MHGVSARLRERRGRVKPHAAQLGWDLRSAGTYIILNAHRHLHGWQTHP